MRLFSKRTILWLAALLVVFTMFSGIPRLFISYVIAQTETPVESVTESPIDQQAETPLQPADGTSQPTSSSSETSSELPVDSGSSPDASSTQSSQSTEISADQQSEVPIDTDTGTASTTTDSSENTSSSTPSDSQQSLIESVFQTATDTIETVVDTIIKPVIETIIDILPAPVSDELKLKAERKDVLGSKDIIIYDLDNHGRPIEGTDHPATFYAYRHGPVSDTPDEETATLIQGKGLELVGEDISQRTNHSKTFATSEPGIYVSEIISGYPQYYKEKNGEWSQIDYATTTPSAFQRQMSFLGALIAYADSGTFFSDPNIENTSVDGQASKYNGGWGTVHDASSGSASDNDTSFNAAKSLKNPDSTFEITRGFFLFDTSSIPDGATVQSATFSLYVNYIDNVENDGNDFVRLATATPASNTAIVNDDYDQVGTTAQATDLDIGSLTNNAYNAFTLNSTGLSNISLTSITKFGTREGHDVSNDPPDVVSGGNGNVVGAYFSETSGTSQDPQLTVVYSDVTPPVISNLQAGSLTETSVVITWTTDDVSDSQVQYGTTSPVLSSSPVYSSSDSATTTSHSISPTGLSSGTTYYFIASSTNSDGLTGTSTESSFSTITEGEGGLSGVGTLQNISFTYDNVGNILTLTDYSTTSLGKAIAFTYDDLYRLTSASTTAATSTPYREDYTYTALGNLTATSTSGSTYTYSGTSYANPHAATDINETTLGNNNVGNLTSYGSNTYGWDYRNRLIASTIGSANDVYLYDHNNDRIAKNDGTATTTYPNRYYTATNSTTTASIYMPDGILLATIEGDGTATSTNYVHTDHLGGTNVVTDSGGSVVQALDYYPYGSKRISSGNDVSQREFIGQVEDPETSLNYLNARYYNNATGQFLSEDPVFWGKQDLQDPQSFNSYSYAGNNPITKKDPTGKWYKEFISGQQSWPSFQGELGQATNQLTQSSPAWNFAVDHPIATSFLAVAPGSVAAAQAGVAAAAAYGAATFPGVGAAYAAQQGFGALFYTTVAGGSLASIPGTTNALSRVNFNNPSSAFPVAFSVTSQVAPTFAGGYVGAFADIFQFVNTVTQGLTQGISGKSGSSSVSPKQSSALSGVVGSFAPTNSAQAKALQNVVSSFTSK